MSGIVPVIPSSYSVAPLGFSQSDISNSFATSQSNPNIPAIPSLESLAGGLAGTGTGTNAGTSTSGAGATGAASSSPTGCSWYDIACWGGAILGRVGIVILGMIMIGVALWMLADKSGVSLPVPVPV